MRRRLRPVRAGNSEIFSFIHRLDKRTLNIYYSSVLTH